MAEKKIVKAKGIKFLSGTEAIAEAVTLVDVDVIAGYPIRPYTAVQNAIAKNIAEGKLDSDFIRSDSEHSQFEVVKHASLTGARVFSGSSGVGWAYGFEPIVIIPTLRLPVVLMLGNRAFDDPGSFGVEWNDALTVRDLGYLMCWPETPQEALDFTLMSYRISEDQRVYLPSILNVEGGVLTHVRQLTEVPSKEEVEKFLPQLDLKHRMHPDNPMTYAPQVDSEGRLILFEIRKVMDEAMKKAKNVIQEVHKEFYEVWGRQQNPFVDEYYAEDAETVILTMGTMAWFLRPVVRKLRKEGKKVGYIRLKRFRPFPTEEMQRTLSRFKVVGVTDRDTSLGAPLWGAALFQEVRSALYDSPEKPLTVNFIVGLGGREPTLQNVEEMFKILLKVVETGKVKKTVHWIGLRE